MIDKVQKIKDWIRKEQDGLMDAQGNFKYPEHEGASHILCKLDAYINSLQEEPKFKVGQYLKQCDIIVKILEVSDDGYHCDSAFIPFSAQNQWGLVKDPAGESLNTESMIESYKQRLIPQVNGMKNSPLIDMCLTSYKHGINETLDTLNLSNTQRAVKNCEDPVSEELEDAAKEYSFIDGADDIKKYARYDIEKYNSFKAGAKWQKQQDAKY